MVWRGIEKNGITNNLLRTKVIAGFGPASANIKRDCVIRDQQ
jgi:hypothetical protein